MAEIDKKQLLGLIAERNRLADIIIGIVLSAPVCTCIDAYKLRGLTAPDCCRCNGPDLDEAEKWVTEQEANEYPADCKIDLLHAGKA